MSKFIVHQEGNIVYAYAFNHKEITLEYPGYTTETVEIDGELWQDVIENPEEYVYKDGQVIHNKPKEVKS